MENAISIEEMQSKIGEYGAKTIWLNIERIGDYQSRVAYRNVFFLAGGSLD